MKTISVKLPEDLDDALNELARRSGLSKSQLVRKAIEALAAGRARSVTKLAGNLVGSLDGPPDLSTHRKHMTGYGR